MRFFHGIRFRDRRGMTLVWLALFLLPLLLFFAGLAIDIAYMYNVKNQLQVAGDAASLAGAANLTVGLDNSSTAFSQLEARQAAWKLACKNTAGGDRVFLYTPGSCNPDSDPTCCDNPPSGGLNEGSNSDPGGRGDIVVGNWNPANTPRFTPATGSTGLAVNAVKVVPKREGQFAAMPAVRVFFGQVLRLIGIDWSLMSAGAEAIATRPPRATGFVSLGSTACTSVSPTGCVYPEVCTLPSPKILGTGSGIPDETFGWTSLLEAPGSTSNFRARICMESPADDVCGRNIYGLYGASVATWRDYQSVMFDPNFDEANKEKDASGNVTAWWVIIPQTAVENPMDPPDPHPVIGHVLVRIIAVCAPGVGTPCRPYYAPPGLCDLYPGTPGVIVIDRISCISCDSAEGGLKAALVK
jgi:hypothetical protein